MISFTQIYRVKFQIILVVFFAFSFFKTSSQDFEKQRLQLTAFNVGFNGLVGGVGSLINKSADENGWQAFSKGFYKGAIGGAISHVGFSLTNQIRTQKNISYAWPARLVNSLGASIIQNAASNDRMFERLHFNLFVARLEYYPYSARFRARLFTSSIYGIIVTSKHARLDLVKSLQSGIIYFDSNQNFQNSLVEGPATGQVSSIGMRSDLFGPSGSFEGQYYDIYAHETAHILQFDRKVAGNAFLINLDKKWKDTLPLYQKMSKYIYFDLNGPIFYVAYSLQSKTHACNFFEQEAENYSARRYYGCN